MATKPVVIKFFAPVIDVTINTLMEAIDQKMRQVPLNSPLSFCLPVVLSNHSGALHFLPNGGCRQRRTKESTSHIIVSLPENPRAFSEEFSDYERY